MKWPEYTIDQLKADIESAIAIGPFGSRMKSDTYVASGIPVIRGNNISDSKVFVGEFVYITPEFADQLKSCNVTEGDLVFPHRGNIGTVGIVGSEAPRYVLSTSLMKLTCNRKLVEPLYLFYYFRSSTGQHELLKHASTVGTPGIGTPLTSLRSIRLPIPPLATQQAISHILGTLDDKIELNRRMNETLEAMARTLFRSWFVDFDPVRAKAEGRKPHGMDAEMAALFPDKFEDSPLGDVPPSWDVVPLPEAIEVNPTRSLAKDTIAPYLEMGNMPTTSARVLAWMPRPCGSGAKFINGDVLLARITPCLENGKTAYVDFLEDGQVGWGSTEYIVFRSKPPLPAEYAYFVARSPELRSHAIQNMTGTSGRQRVPAECFNSFLVVMPPSEIARQFGVWSRSVLHMMKARDEESSSLAAIRDALLPKLLSGEMRLMETLKAIFR